LIYLKLPRPAQRRGRAPGAARVHRIRPHHVQDEPRLYRPLRIGRRMRHIDPTQNCRWSCI